MSLPNTYEMLAKWLISGKLKFSFGKITLLEQNIVMIPVEIFTLLTKYVLEHPSRDLEKELYLISWKTAYDYIKRFVESYNLVTFEERYKLGMDVASMAGFGAYATISYKEGHHSYFKVIGNPIAEYFFKKRGNKKIIDKVDIILRGINAGGGTACHMKLVQDIEIECAASNGRECIFLTGTEKAFKDFGCYDIYKEQILSLGKDLIKEQKNYLKKKGFPKIDGDSFVQKKSNPYR